MGRTSKKCVCNHINININIMNILDKRGLNLAEGYLLPLFCSFLLLSFENKFKNIQFLMMAPLQAVLLYKSTYIMFLLRRRTYSRLRGLDKCYWAVLSDTTT